MLWFGETTVAKEELYGTKKPIKIWNVNVDQISKLIETKTNSEYYIGCLDKVITLFVLIFLVDMLKPLKLKIDIKIINLCIFL